MVDEALELGYEVYLINPRQLVYYRKAVNERNKTDPIDAWLLARYLEHEGGLRPFQPRAPRHNACGACSASRNRSQEPSTAAAELCVEVQISIQALMTQFQYLLVRIDQEILNLIRELGWWSDYQRCLSIPGIGQANAQPWSPPTTVAASPAVMPSYPTWDWMYAFVNPVTTKVDAN